MANRGGRSNSSNAQGRGGGGRSGSRGRAGGGNSQRGQSQSRGRSRGIGSGRINVSRLDGDEYNPPPQRTRGRSEPAPRRLGDWVDNDPPPPQQFTRTGERAPESATDWARDQGYGGARPRTTAPVRQSSRGGRLMGRSYADPSELAPGTAPYWSSNQGHGGARPRTTSPVRQPSRGSRPQQRSHPAHGGYESYSSGEYEKSRGYGGARPRTTSPVRQSSGRERLVGRSYADPSELAPGTAPYWSSNMGYTTPSVQAPGTGPYWGYGSPDSSEWDRDSGYARVRPRTTSPVRQSSRPANPRDVMEDLRSVAVRECLGHDDPTATFYERRFERVPLHHRANWHLDRLQINAPSPQDPRQLPQMTMCYAGRTDICHMHSPDDTDSACHMNPYHDIYKTELERYYERHFYVFMRRTQRLANEKEAKYDRWDRRTGARLPRSRLNLELTPPRESDEDEEDEC